MILPSVEMPSLSGLLTWLRNADPYLVACCAIIAGLLLWIAFLCRRPRPAKGTAESKTPRAKTSLENRLTYLVGVITGGICAQGMGKYFYDKLHFPIELVIVVGGVLELAAFTCALRARRNIRNAKNPEDARAGIDGIAVWVIAGGSGAFSAMDANDFSVALFRLLLPFLAAWLWERAMSDERRQARGTSGINWRITPERVLVWLRVAEPTGRTASEVDAHRRLTLVAKAAKRVRRLRSNNAWKWRIERAQARLEHAMDGAVAHAGLSSDPERQQALLAQIGSLFNAAALADLTPDAPWAQFAKSTQQTWFEIQGLSFSPAVTMPERRVAASHSIAAPRVTPEVTLPVSDPVTPKALTQATPEPLTHATTRVTDPATSKVTPDEVTQVTPDVTPESVPQGTSEVTTQDTRPPSRKSAGRRQSKRTRSDEELIVDLEKIVAEHYRDHPRKEIKVLPIAKQLGIGRDRARFLLDQMNVRPIRKVSG